MAETHLPNPSFEALKDKVTDLFESIKSHMELPGKAELKFRQNDGSMNTAAHPVSGDIIFFVGDSYAKRLDTESLAFMIAHELSHASLEHAKSISELEKTHGVNSLYEAQSKLKGEQRQAYSDTLKQTEFEADANALQVLQKMGMDTSKALVALQELGSTQSFTHPSGTERIQALQAIQADKPNNMQTLLAHDHHHAAIGVHEDPHHIHVRTEEAKLVDKGPGQSVVQCTECIGRFDKTEQNAVYIRQEQELSATEQTTLSRQIVSQPDSEQGFLKNMLQNLEAVKDKELTSSTSQSRPTAEQEFSREL